jgi:hypothetical protein
MDTHYIVKGKLQEQVKYNNDEKTSRYDLTKTIKGKKQ